MKVHKEFLIKTVCSSGRCCNGLQTKHCWEFSVHVTPNKRH